jgi:putative salt-induced outer membrane protein
MSRLSMFAVLACTALPAIALADDPKFQFGKAEEVEKVKDVEWDAAAEVGVVFTTGNSETTTATGSVRASRKTGYNKIAIEGSLTYARSGLRVLEDLNGNGLIDDESEIRTQSSVTANTLASKIRYDRFLTKHNSLYIAALAARDVPAGKDAVLGGQVGYSRQIHKTKTSEAVAEIGLDYSHEDLVAGSSVSIISARGFLGFKGDMTEGTTLDTSIEALTNLNEETLATRGGEPATIGEDTRINAKAAISAKVGQNLAFQSSIEMKYDHRPGPLALKNLAMGFVPEASTLDTIMKASLIYTFF